MTLQSHFDEVESIEFATYLDVVSGFNVLLMALEDSDVVNHLIIDLGQTPQHEQDVYERIVAILPDNPQPEYRHPLDTALTGYLYALNEVESQYTESAVEKVRETPKLWWALWMANHIHESLKTTT